MSFKRAIIFFVKSFLTILVLMPVYMIKILPFRHKILGIYCDIFNFAQSHLRSSFLYGGERYIFLANSSYSEYRSRTSLSKEPDTIKWIESFSHDDVLYDVGANIGIYTIIAAKSKNVKVYSFEPSFHNLVHLTENVRLNGVTDNVCIVPCPLFQKSTVDKFTLSETIAGSAIANFATGTDQVGAKISNELSYTTLGFSLDDLTQLGGLSLPTKMKLDVDGIEHLILSGARDLLKSKTLNGVLVEVSDDFEEQKSTINAIMLDSGFRLRDTASRQRKSSSKNQIWVK